MPSNRELHPITAFLLIVHFAATWYLAGLCWMVQRVQYPLMSRVGTASFPEYERAHVERIGPVVAPAMVVEVATAGLLLIGANSLSHSPVFVASLVLLAKIWLSTFFIQVPLHDKLVRGFDPAAHASLVRTNWIRTLAWSARGLMLAWLLWENGAGRGAGLG